MLLLPINRTPYMASPMTPSLLTLNNLERSKSRSARFSVVVPLNGIIYLQQVYYYHLNLVVTQGSFVGGGVFRCPSGLSCLFTIGCGNFTMVLAWNNKGMSPW